MITITQSALDKIKSILDEEDNKNLKLRTSVQGGGCAGFSYGFNLEDTIAEDDFIIEGTEELVVIDSMSMQYLAGSTIDYQESLMGASFVIDNPNANTTCGCGSSFSMPNDFFGHDPSFDS